MEYKVLVSNFGAWSDLTEFKELFKGREGYEYKFCFSNRNDKFLGLAFVTPNDKEMWNFLPVGQSLILAEGELICVPANVVTKSA